MKNKTELNRLSRIQTAQELIKYLGDPIDRSYTDDHQRCRVYYSSNYVEMTWNGHNHRTNGPVSIEQWMANSMMVGIRLFTFYGENGPWV